MSNKDPRDETPSVIYEGLSKTASFFFRDKKYALPGKYGSLCDAKKAAEEKCRLMGWNG